MVEPAPDTAGKVWTPNEDAELFSEIGGNESAAVIAARHGRSVRAIESRVARLARSLGTFANGQEAIHWVRWELRRRDQSGREEEPGRGEGLGQVEQVPWWWGEQVRPARIPGRVPAVEVGPPTGPRPVSAQDQPWTKRAQRERAQRARQHRAVAALWASLTSLPVEEFTDCPEVPILGGYDEQTLLAAGARLVRRHAGRLCASDWVLECDWPDVEIIRLSAAQLRAGQDATRLVCVELIESALIKVPDAVDRAMLSHALGLSGQSLTDAEVGRLYGIKRERLRQRITRGLKQLWVAEPDVVFRAWDHSAGVLRAVLSGRDGALDSELVAALIELALPRAAFGRALTVITFLCGRRPHEVWAATLGVLARWEDRRLDQLRTDRAKGRLAARLDALVAKVDWPPHPAGAATRAACSADSSPLRALRAPRDPDDRSYSGLWMSQRLRREVGYDSKTELEFIQLIDLAPNVVSYCEQPQEIAYEWLGRVRTYYPDFAVDLVDGRRFLVEIKAGLEEFALHQNVVKFAAARRHCHARGWGFIAAARGKAPADLLARTVAGDQARYLRELLATGPLSWTEVKALMRERGLSNLDLATLILRNGWYWYLQPYQLSIVPPAARPAAVPNEGNLDRPAFPRPL